MIHVSQDGKMFDVLVVCTESQFVPCQMHYSTLNRRDLLEVYIRLQVTVILLHFQVNIFSHSPSNYLLFILYPYGASLVAQMVKNLPAMRETWV